MGLDFDTLFPTLNHVTNRGLLRQQPADFDVTEVIEIDFTGSGEHWWFYVEKINSNTAWAATQLASACRVPARQVGYAGLKDRHAVTRQWFSVQLPKVTDLATITAQLPPEIRILESQQHQSKLKRGQLQHNRFALRIRQVEGDREQLTENLGAISQQGVPNYFGPQRFGHQMTNIQRVQDWFRGRIRVRNKNQRSLLLSTARSHLFNLTVAHRIKQGLWDQVIPGDLLQLDGSQSWFHEQAATAAELRQRLAAFDLHITAPLWGEGPLPSTLDCASLEQGIAEQWPIYAKGFAQHRLQHDRRSMRLRPQALAHEWQGNDLLISMQLPAGCYATSVLRELLHVTDQQTKD
ncbi:tRNA pseudouridine(13) synthase TruD [Marinicella meishanensis]|uniref:tRNA pseudouridine(13) synthase TruD n=1 Tax=Marinicella meishanensis TaxID=2873263 RepID=UPI001CBCEBBC|nr:tRNA pseudouridine(13) synthase TruD [Marinicella sp. NBU2979]